MSELDLDELRKMAESEVPCHDPFAWIAPEEVISLLDAVDAQRREIDALEAVEPPRWEDDKLVKERGWDRPESCKKCGEPHAGYLAQQKVVEAARQLQIEYPFRSKTTTRTSWNGLDDALTALDEP